MLIEERAGDVDDTDTGELDAQDVACAPAFADGEDGEPLGIIPRLIDESGEVLATFTASKSLGSVVYSAADVESGASYSIVAPSVSTPSVHSEPCGALVRLTGSGLGCDDWPNCNDQRLVDVSTGHAAIELPAPLSQAACAPASFAALNTVNIGGNSSDRCRWWIRCSTRRALRSGTWPWMPATPQPAPPAWI